MDICTITPKLSFFLSLILILFAFTSSDDSKDKEECAEPLVGLATCLAYVGGTAKAPTPDCCSGLKQVLKTNKKCLCVVIKDRNDPDLGLNINATLALGLPDVCNAPANVSLCPALLNLPPNSPDAQIFYQIGQKSNNTTAASPVAGGPIASAAGASAPVRVRGSIPGGTTSSTRNNSGGGRVKGKRWRGLEIMCGLILILLSALII
ncbi:protein yls3 [Phtheirospermum japonicum]|uniref:Protein yls3 n=1 Tax=Phtheirospermum japonicum TaxID=374723 RepID=A0A830C7Z1_9LAMI|nr:protein yls3 [Phtheirospermum japonicum]